MFKFRSKFTSETGPRTIRDEFCFKAFAFRKNFAFKSGCRSPVEEPSGAFEHPITAEYTVKQHLMIFQFGFIYAAPVAPGL
eukprot:jgi/Botrbrau1/4304/Bobra.0390s0043.1